MKKVALLVKASVMTRVVIDVDDDFCTRDIDNTINGTLTDEEWDRAVCTAIPRLKDNISSDNIDGIGFDYEFPYDQGFDDSVWK